MPHSRTEEIDPIFPYTPVARSAPPLPRERFSPLSRLRALDQQDRWLFRTTSVVDFDWASPGGVALADHALKPVGWLLTCLT